MLVKHSFANSFHGELFVIKLRLSIIILRQNCS